MNIAIRQMTAADTASWAGMRAALWPEENAQEHASGVEDFLRGENMWGFVAESADGAPLGFAELALRPYANGCDSQPIPFLEGIWVRADMRRKGVGAALLKHIEDFATARGHSELGSDSELHRTAAHAAHKGWGFEETERVVYFRKRL